jgi:hypothetical protein
MKTISNWRADSSSGVDGFHYMAWIGGVNKTITKNGKPM